MRITVINEHETCPYNGKGEKPILEKFEIVSEQEINIQTNSNKIILVMEGEIDTSIGISRPQRVKAKEMFYVAVEQRLIIRTHLHADFLVFRIQNRIKFCSCFLLEKLSSFSKKYKDQLMNETGLKVLPVDQSIIEGMKTAIVCLNENFICQHYYNLKLNELLFLIGKFYTIEELVLFFKDSLSGDIMFSDYVRANAHKYKTMTELAEAMNYTISGFEKRFKKIFKATPYQWMKEKKAQRIFYDLSMTDRCLKEIVDIYGFKSNNYFIDFCKSNFGASPGVIRKNRGNGQKT
ncbi:helix-turn-helix domain-containing protein [Massilibacteroides sp.]|uniref:helix-turn-helix domain-containing protein n=1 Tax=Massilibacteroides sp. TaxID=2034766 RepID=UPI002601DC47|nr:helix-turn-helix domain-containing protein [Massilibacteroides sp.]MDD4516173.1 helix-turn-helix domain-containing protein [Massilibacteroides sp.]